MSDIIIASRKSPDSKKSKVGITKRTVILTQIHLFHFVLFSSLSYMMGSYYQAGWNGSLATDFEQLGQMVANSRTIVIFTILSIITFRIYSKYRIDLFHSPWHIVVFTLCSMILFFLFGISALGEWWNQLPWYVNGIPTLLSLILFVPVLVSLLFLPISYLRFIRESIREKNRKA